MKMSTFLNSMRKMMLIKACKLFKVTGGLGSIFSAVSASLWLYSKLLRVFEYRNHIIRTPYQAGYFSNVTNKSIEDKGRYKRREG